MQSRQCSGTAVQLRRATQVQSSSLVELHCQSRWHWQSLSLREPRKNPAITTVGVLWGSVHVATPVVVTGVIGLLLENLGETNDSTPLYASTSIAHFPSVSLMSLV